jgi:hypothetical protein
VVQQLISSIGEGNNNNNNNENNNNNNIHLFHKFTVILRDGISSKRDNIV